jgi:hypothetical protein
MQSQEQQSKQSPVKIWINRALAAGCLILALLQFSTHFGPAYGWWLAIGYVLIGLVVCFFTWRWQLLQHRLRWLAWLVFAMWVIPGIILLFNIVKIITSERFSQLSPAMQMISAIVYTAVPLVFLLFTVYLAPMTERHGY